MSLSHAFDIEHIKQVVAGTRQRAVNMVPVIMLYVVLFCGITALFGVGHMMVISCAVCIFMNRKVRENNASMCAAIFFMMILLAVLAYVATLNLFWCILLNATVPFALVLTNMNRVMPKGYFGFVMTFVFLELRPLPFDEFLIQLQTVVFAAAVLVAAIALWHAWQQRTHPGDITSASLDALADILDRMAAGEHGHEIARECLELEREFDRLRIKRHHALRQRDRREYAYTMYAILFQRLVYLHSDDAWRAELGERVDPDMFHELALIVRQVRAARTPEDYARIARIIQIILYVVEVPAGRMRVFFRSFLHMLVLILRVESSPAAQAPRAPWRAVPWRELVEDARQSINLDSFEFRFACRLSVVLVISCSLNLVLGIEYFYWITLNSFILLMPSYEESTHRMRTRPVGTAIGCVASMAIAHLLPSTFALFAVSLTLIACMYCCTPGSWVQAVFATTFAMLMVSLTLDTATAAWMRLLSVLIAVGLVLLVNRFVAPSRRDRVFTGNIHLLEDQLQTYWQYVRDTIYGEVDLARSGELLTQFHLIYAEALDFADSLPDEGAREATRERLATLWRMFAEVEAVEYIAVADDKVEDRDLGTLWRMAGVFHDRPRSDAAYDLLRRLAASMRCRSLAYTLDHYIDDGARYAKRGGPDDVAQAAV